MADTALVEARSPSLEQDASTESLLDSVRDQVHQQGTWRLNFNRFQRPDSQSPKHILHDCLKKLGSVNRVDEYYQQQEEMLEKFVEMDAITISGSFSGRSKVRKSHPRGIIVLSSTISF